MWLYREHKHRGTAKLSEPECFFQANLRKNRYRLHTFSILGNLKGGSAEYCKINISNVFILWFFPPYFHNLSEYLLNDSVLKSKVDSVWVQIELNVSMYIYIRLRGSQAILFFLNRNCRWNFLCVELKITQEKHSKRVARSWSEFKALCTLRALNWYSDKNNGWRPGIILQVSKEITENFHFGSWDKNDQGRRGFVCFVF